MSSKKQTYAVRLAVEGGGRVKAELTDIGKSGDKSIRKIETASSSASKGLMRLGDRAKSLTGSIRSLHGAIIGAVVMGGFAALINRSIDLADQIGKTSAKLGIGAEALQELRYAASLAGIEQRTLDMGLQRFTRRTAEAAKGTGEAKEALKQLGISIKDQNGNIRKTEDMMGDLADAFRGVGDPAERLRLAFKLFDSEGVAMVNMLVQGKDALDETRQHARSLGIVIEEDLIRNAEAAQDELDTLSKVISANLTKAVLGLAPAISDASSYLAEFAADAGIAYEHLKFILSGEGLEGLSEHALKRSIDNQKKLIAGFKAELASIGQTEWWNVFDNGQKDSLTREIELQEIALKRYQEILDAKYRVAEFVDAAPAIGQGQGVVDIEADIKAHGQAATRIKQIQDDLNKQLFDINHQGADRIRAEYQRLADELQTLIQSNINANINDGEIAALLNQAGALRDKKLSELQAKQEAIRAKEYAQNQNIIADLQAENNVLYQNERQVYVNQAVRKLSAAATKEQQAEVKALASELYDEKQALEAKAKAEEAANQLKAKGRSLTLSLRHAEEIYTDELKELNALLQAGAIDLKTYSQAVEEAHQRMDAASQDWSSGISRALRNYANEASNAAKQFENVTNTALQSSEDAFVQWAMTGKFSAADLFNSIAEEAIRAAYRMMIAEPIAGLFSSLFSNIGSSLFSSSGTGLQPVEGLSAVAHTGGLIGKDHLQSRMVSPALFAGADYYHSGGLVTGLKPREVPIIAMEGERVLTEAQQANTARTIAALANRGNSGAGQVNIIISNQNANAKVSANSNPNPNGGMDINIMVEEIETRFARNIAKGEGMAPVLEGRYGLNPAVGARR